MALADAGFTVDAVCPWRHSLTKLRSIHRAYTHYGFSPADSFEEAILASKPDLVVPCDDVSALHLHRLYRKYCRRHRNPALSRLIERSLGAGESFPVLYRRADFIQISGQEGIRTPTARSIASVNDLKEWAQTEGFPAVLKADSTSGSEGVRIVHTLEQAERAFASLSAPPLVARAVKRALIDQDCSLVRSSLLRHDAVLSAHSFIRGCEATSTVACWQGKVLASLHFEVVNKMDATGHSTVLRIIENAEMAFAAETMVHRLGLSGIAGFDFILEAETGNAYLIEINPRATQVGHLTLGPDRDLPAALFSCVSGRPIQEAPTVTDNNVIALFPQEWMRDPASPYLRSVHHDVPWGEPELIRACVRRRRKQRASYGEQETPRTLSLARERHL